MSAEPSSPTFRDERQIGFTLVEVLTTIVVAMIVSATLVQFLLAVTRFRREGEVRLETQQGLRAALDSLARDIRLAGACLPTLGSFIPLAGTDSGTRDEITVRTGLFDANQACIRTTLRDAMPADSREIKVASTDGFAQDMRAYLVLPDATSGEIFTITQVQAAALMLQKDAPSTQVYPVNSGVFALQERTYAVDTTLLTIPLLTLAMDGQPAQPLAAGIDLLNIQYRLRRNCPPCDTVDLPTDADTWRLVTDMTLTARATFPSALRAGQPYSLSTTIRVKPRNLLPP